MEKSLKIQGFARLTEDEAREHLEQMRWTNGVICPHCSHNEAYKLNKWLQIYFALLKKV